MDNFSPALSLTSVQEARPGTALRKVIGVPLQKDYQKQDNGLLVRGYFTSDNRDEVGDIITRGATERATERYRQWGNIRRMHLPDPVAKVVRMGAADGLDWNEVEILVIDPKAVFEVENGLLQALSIGAIVNFDDIDFLEDGGWVINDYSLAEISLVDHPANYDARLSAKAMSKNARMLARSYGLATVLRELPQVFNGQTGEAIMAEQVEQETEAPVEEVEVQADLASNITEAVVEEVEETPAVAETEEAVEAVEAEEPAPAAVEEVVVEASIDEAIVAHTEEETTEATEEEAPVEEAEEQAVEEQPELNFTEEFRSLSAAVNTLTAVTEQLAKQLEALQAQASPASEQTEGIVAEAENADTEDQPGPVATERGAVASSPIVEEDTASEPEQQETVHDLRRSLAEHFRARAQNR